jgi:hypothetical protein
MKVRNKMKFRNNKGKEVRSPGTHGFPYPPHMLFLFVQAQVPGTSPISSQSNSSFQTFKETKLSHNGDLLK